MLGTLLLNTEAFLVIQILFITLFSVLLNENTLNLKYKFNVFSFVHLLSCLILFYAILILWNNIYYEAIILNYQLICDNIAFFFKFIVLFMSLFSILFTLNYCQYEGIKIYEYLILLLLATVGILTIISSYDLITMYLAIELQSLCFYIVTNLKFYSNFSIEAGLKYFILGALSSGILLFGASLLYGFTGATNFLDLTVLHYYNNIDYYNLYHYEVSLIGILFVYCGILFKIGVVPFHMWISDIYEGAPTNITLFFAIVPQISIISLLLRLNLVFYHAYLTHLYFFFLGLSILSISIGTLGAIYQIKLKRLFAYSSISNIGYILSIMCSVNIENMFGIIFYIIIYNIITLGLWLILLSLRNRSNFYKIKNISELFVLYTSNKYLSFIFLIFLFSAMGIPPMLGFFSKLYIYLNIIQMQMYFFSVFLVVFSSIGVIYYLRLIKVMFSFVTKKIIFLIDIAEFKAFFLILLVYLNIFFFLYPIHFSLLIHNLLIYMFF